MNTENVRPITEGQKRELQIVMTKAWWKIVDQMGFDTAKALMEKPGEMVQSLGKTFLPNPVIDCDSRPYALDRYNRWVRLPDERQFPQRVNGLWMWNPSSIAIIPLPEKEFQDYYYSKSEIGELIKGKRVFGSKVIDLLEDNPYLVPEYWFGKTIYFIGDVFSSGEEHVECISPSKDTRDPLYRQHSSIYRGLYASNRHFLAGTA